MTVAGVVLLLAALVPVILLLLAAMGFNLVVCFWVIYHTLRDWLQLK